MKVIVHYTNGEPYTIKDMFILYVEWESKDIVTVHGEAGQPEVWCDTFEDVLFLEEVDKECGVVKLFFSPDTPMSVKVDVMTAKARSKANRKGVKDE